MPIRIFVLAVVLSFVTLNAGARELTDITLDIAGVEAKQEAFDQATEQATRQMVEELIGPERLARYWSGLRTKLLKNSTRFILFMKGAQPQTINGVTHITVSMKVAPDTLETLLREEGVMASGAVKVLPLVEIWDPTRTRFVWWGAQGDEEKPTLAQEMFKKFLTRLAAKFRTKNIYVLDPSNPSFRMSVPATYRADNLRREDQMLLAQYLKADVVLSGRVMASRQVRDNSELKLVYELQMWQSKSGRDIGEVQRAEKLGSEAPKAVQAAMDQSDRAVMDELSSKLSEALASGNLNLNVVRLAVSGSMSYKQQAEFKRLLGQMREVKVLKERLFEPSRVTFEVETPVTGSELGKALQKAKFPLYTIAVDSAQDDSLALSVRALSSASAQ